MAQTLTDTGYNNNNNRRLVTLAEHTSDHGRQTNSSTEEKVEQVSGQTSSTGKKSQNKASRLQLRVRHLIIGRRRRICQEEHTYGIFLVW